MRELNELAKRFSDEEIAVKIGVTARSVFNWRKGKKPSKLAASKILEVCKKLTTKVN